MTKIISYIGPQCTGKTTSLLKDLKLQQKELNNKSTLVSVVKNEESLFKEVLPNATFLSVPNLKDEKFTTLVFDKETYKFDNLQIYDADCIYIVSQRPLNFNPISKEI